MKRPAWLTTPRWLRRLGASLLVGGQAVSAIAKGRIGFNDLMQELMEAGPGSFLIVLITALAAGTVFNIQVAAELSKQGASATVGGLLALGLSREIAPLLTATLLTGKVATAYAAQIGTMKVTEQIDAITMLRTDPVEYLVVPRVIAMVIMAPVQCLLFFWVGIWSGQVSSTLLYNIPPAVFWNSVRTWMEPNDLPSTFIPAIAPGYPINRARRMAARTRVKRPTPRRIPVSGRCLTVAVARGTESKAPATRGRVRDQSIPLWKKR